MTTRHPARYPPAVDGPLVTVLSWDSEFFGIPIGRANLTGATCEALAQIDSEARSLGLACLYGALDPSVGTTAELAQIFGHRLVEVALTFGRAAVPFTPRPTRATVRCGTPADLPGLDDVIETLAPWSRFATDPRFGRSAAVRMFQAWAERAACDGEERMLLIAEDDTGITGLSTNVRSPVPRVDLMGVLSQGSGASWALMRGLVDWAGPVAVEAGPCAARNIAPLRFLEHCGFSVARVEYRYHRWLDEEVATPR